MAWYDTIAPLGKIKNPYETAQGQPIGALDGAVKGIGDAAATMQKQFQYADQKQRDNDMFAWAKQNAYDTRMMEEAKEANKNAEAERLFGWNTEWEKYKEKNRQEEASKARELELQKRSDTVTHQQSLLSQQEKELALKQKKYEADLEQQKLDQGRKAFESLSAGIQKDAKPKHQPRLPTDAERKSTKLTYVSADKSYRPELKRLIDFGLEIDGLHVGGDGGVYVYAFNPETGWSDTVELEGK